MSQDLMNIAAFKGMVPSNAFKVLDPQSESLADGIGSSYGIIGYKGKVWSLRLRGETYNFTRADDGSPAAFLDVIILRQLPNKSKSFYPPNSYQDGQIGTRPLCAALDGITPDADITTPESTACAVCPRNVFKVSPDGRKTRDCSDYKRLAVLIVPSMSKALLGAPLIEPVFLRVPAASLNDLALLGEGMAAQGFHFSSFVTRIGFNPEKPHPQMTFRALQPLGDKEAGVVLPLREDPTASRITGENEINRPRPALAAPVKAQEGEPALPLAKPDPNVTKMPPPNQTRPNNKPAAGKPATKPETDLGFGDDTAAVTSDPVARVVAKAVAKAAAKDEGLGFDDVGEEAPVQPAKVQVAANDVSDTGAPEETDDDLDARVRALLPQV